MFENNCILGFAYGYELNRLDKQGNMLYIHSVDVAPEYQRKGIAKGIFKVLKKICSERDICRIFLITEKSNIPANNLYKTTGGIAAHEDDIVYTFNEL